MADTYVVACSRIWQKPWWQDDPAATTWQTVMGQALDDQIDQLEQARAVRYPTNPSGAVNRRCPTDALYYLADERGLEQVPTETEDQWRERLRRAWPIWHVAGTAVGHTDGFAWYPLRNVGVFRRREWSTPAPVGSEWVRAFARTAWSQFDALIQQPHPWRVRLWGEGTWGDGGTWGSTMSAAHVAYFKRQLRQFASGHSTPVYMHLAFTQARIWGGYKWGDGGLWGSGGNVMPVVVGDEDWERRGVL